MGAGRAINSFMRANCLKDGSTVRKDGSVKKRAVINDGVRMIIKEEAVFKNSLIRIEIEESEVPWLKVFTQAERREFSECTHDEKMAILEALDLIEKEMLSYYRPTKINIASFGNYVPLVHWHIMARFKEDSYFPEPMWGTKQRVSSLDLPPFELFCAQVNLKLEKKVQ